MFFKFWNNVECKKDVISGQEEFNALKNEIKNDTKKLAEEKIKINNEKNSYVKLISSMKKEYQILHKNYSKLQEKLAKYELHFSKQKNQIKQYKQPQQQQNYFNKRKYNNYSDDEVCDVEVTHQKTKKQKQYFE